MRATPIEDSDLDHHHGLLLAVRAEQECALPLRRLAHAHHTNMIPSVKWWRAKSAPQTAGRADWFDENRAFPGFVVSMEPCKGNVRLFRDLDAFRAHDGSFSIDLPQKSVEEVLAPS